MPIKLPVELRKTYRTGAALPCNPAFIAGKTIDFTKLTIDEAEWLISIGSPHLKKNDAPKTAKRDISDN